MSTSTKAVERFWWLVTRQQDDSYRAVNEQADQCEIASEVYQLLERLIDHLESGNEDLGSPENSYEDELLLPGSMVVGADFLDWQSVYLGPRNLDTGGREFTLEGRVSIDTDYTPGHSDGEPVRRGAEKCYVTLCGRITQNDIVLETVISNGPGPEYLEEYYGEDEPAEELPDDL